MLFCFGLFALLLYNTVVANAVCSFTYSKKDIVHAVSLEYQKQGYVRCVYSVEAPEETYIQLNFTDLIGFQPPSPSSSTHPNLHIPDFQTSTSSVYSRSSLSSSLLSTSSSSSAKAENCLPPELVINVKTRDGVKDASDIVCKTKNYKTPQVFHFYSSSLQVIYVWEQDKHTGFSLEIDFHQKNNCVILCDKALTCLTSESLVCNQVYDCLDKVDEKHCPPLPLYADASFKLPVVTTIVIIVIFVVLMPVLAVFLCVVGHCKTSARMRRWRSRDRAGVDHRQLRPHSQGSEVVSMPTSSSTTSNTQDQLEQQIALLRERHTLMQSARTGMEIGMPPQIAISQDGEEGYMESQHRLASHPKHEIYQSCFRPPPNKTVYDKDSPPPYFSCTPPSTESMGHDTLKIVRDSNGCSHTVKSLCYNSLSSSHEHHKDKCAHHTGSSSCRNNKTNNNSSTVSASRGFPNLQVGRNGTNRELNRNRVSPGVSADHLPDYHTAMSQQRTSTVALNKAVSDNQV